MDNYCIYFDKLDFRKETSVKNLQWQIEYSDRRLRELEELKAVIIEYKNDLSEYAQSLLTMNYSLELELRRYKQYYGNITYYLKIYKVYDNGNRSAIIDETYGGKERHKALARFEELKKQHPGIKAIKDIEKGKWER